MANGGDLLFQLLEEDAAKNTQFEDSLNLLDFRGFDPQELTPAGTTRRGVPTQIQGVDEASLIPDSPAALFQDEQAAQQEVPGATVGLRKAVGQAKKKQKSRSFEDVFKDVEQTLGLEVTDELVNDLVQGNTESAERIFAALSTSQQDQRNVVDKYSPIAEGIAFLVDAFSGNKRRRNLAPENLRKIQALRKGRVADREKKARQRFLDKVGVEELTGKLRGQSFGAQTGAVEQGNLNKRAVAQEAGAQFRGEQQRPLNPLQQAQLAQLSQADDIIDDIRAGAKSLSSLDEGDRLIMGQAGYPVPPTPDQQFVTLFNDISDKAEKRYGKAIVQAQTDGDTEAEQRLINAQALFVRNEFERFAGQ